MDDSFIFVKIWETTLNDRHKAAPGETRRPNLISPKRKTSIFKVFYYFISGVFCRIKSNEAEPPEGRNPIAIVTVENLDEDVVVARNDEDDSLPELMAKTLKHSALSMFVTSFTTAAAFFVSYLSNITAIRCFGLVFHIL